MGTLDFKGEKNGGGGGGKGSSRRTIQGKTGLMEKSFGSGETEPDLGKKGEV